MIDTADLVELRDGTDYQRDNFDDFLYKIKFSFSIPSVHIAGTNGKGSTANYIASIYHANGYKVGLFTSPALYEVNEMIKVNDKEIEDDEIKNIIKDNKKLIEKYELSSFEVLTFIAFTYFTQKECDICVIECGMGGETDATNIFTPVLSIITSVTLEHTGFLGRSISEITKNKAGIIKDEVPLLIGKLSEDSINVISDIIKKTNSKIFVTGDAHQPQIREGHCIFTYGSYKDVKLRSVAIYSVINACLALDAIEILKEQFPVEEEKVYLGLNQVVMPCRMEIVSSDPLTIIDGGHNPEAFEKLTRSMQNLPVFRKIHVLFACFKDKNMMSMLSSIGAISESITLTTFPHPRARNKEDYFLFAEDYSFIDDPMEAYNDLKTNYPEDIILITGSLAFAAYMSRRLKNERR